MSHAVDFLGVVVYPTSQSLTDGSDGYGALVLAILPVFEVPGCKYDDSSTGRYGFHEPTLSLHNLSSRTGRSSVLSQLGFKKG